MASLTSKAPVSGQVSRQCRSTRRSVAALSSCGMRMPKAQMFASASPCAGSRQVAAALVPSRVVCQAAAAPASASSSSASQTQVSNSRAAS